MFARSRGFFRRACTRLRYGGHQPVDLLGLCRLEGGFQREGFADKAHFLERLEDGAHELAACRRPRAVFDEGDRAFLEVVLGDIVQQVFMKLVKNIDNLESEEHVKAWLIRVAVNEGKSLFSSSWRRRVLSIEDLGAAGELSVRQPEVRESNRIMDAVFRLPEKYRVVVHLFYYHDLSTDEIAKVLGRSNHTVRSQLSRAREKMRTDLKEVFDDVR